MDNFDFDCEFLTREEEMRLAKRALRGDDEARNRVIMGMYPIIRKTAAKMAKERGQDIEELTNIGMQRVLEKFHLFNPKRGFRASTYFVRVAWSEMLKFCGEDASVSLPRGGKVTAVNEEARERAKSCVYLSQITVDAQGKPSELGALLLDRRSIMSPDAAEKREDVLRLHQAIKKLPKRSRAIVELRMAGQSLRVIGEAFRLSKERIRQIETKAHEKIARAMSA